MFLDLFRKRSNPILKDPLIRAIDAEIEYRRQLGLDIHKLERAKVDRVNQLVSRPSCHA